MDQKEKQDSFINIETGNLLNFMKPGIVALIDYRNSRAYLSDAVNIVNNLMRQYQLIDQGQHTVQKEDLQYFKPVVVKLVEDTRDLKYAYADAYTAVTRMGLKVISRTIKYKVRGMIREDFRQDGQRYLYYVHLYSQRRPVKLLGVFSNFPEAQEFMAVHYPDRNIKDSQVVVSNNQLTVSYLDKQSEREYDRLMGLL